MLRSSLCHYSDAYILVSGTITIDRPRADDAAKQLFKNCAQFIDCNCFFYY